MKKLAAFLAAASLPVAAFAQTSGPGELKNPLRGINNLSDLAVKLLDIVVQVGAYVAVLFIIWSGFLFVKARGNPKELEDAKKTFLYTIIGVAILLGAKAISLGISATITTITR